MPDTVQPTTPVTPAATVTRTTTVTRTVVPVQNRTPARGWLKTLGWLSILVGILGLIPTVRDITHDYGLHLEGGMAAFHWGIGIVALVCAYALRKTMHVAIATIAIGAIFLIVGALTFLSAEDAFWHAGVADNVGHLLAGVITLLVGITALNRERELGRTQTTVARAA